jgi:hypothetical protein
MVIHGRGYRPLSYRPLNPFWRLWPIALIELRTMFRSRIGVGVFIACLTPSVGSLIFLLVREGVWQLGPGERPPDMEQFSERMNPESPWFYASPIVHMSFVPFLLLTGLVTTRAVAKDRVANALEIYWTRGLSPLGYFLGKWLGSILLVGSAFVLAPFVLWLVSVGMAPDWTRLQVTSSFMPSVLLGLLAFTAVLTFLGVCLSSLAGTPNFASILWVFLMIGTAAVGRILGEIFRGNDWFVAVNPWDAGVRLIAWTIGKSPLRDYDPGIAVACLLATVVSCAVLAARRLRSLEAIG